MQGPQGVQGPKGDMGNQGIQGNIGPSGAAATISIGTVASGTGASVVNAGTSNAAIFNFILPRGSTGPSGAQGIQGPSGVNATTTSLASTTGNGLMSSGDFSKLSGLPNRFGFGTLTIPTTLGIGGATGVYFVPLNTIMSNTGYNSIISMDIASTSLSLLGNGISFTKQNQLTSGVNVIVKNTALVSLNAGSVLNVFAWGN